MSSLGWRRWRGRVARSSVSLLAAVPSKSVLINLAFSPRFRQRPGIGCGGRFGPELQLTVPPGGVSGESARVFVKTVQSSAAGCCGEEVGRRAGRDEGMRGERSGGEVEREAKGGDGVEKISCAEPESSSA